MSETNEHVQATSSSDTEVPDGFIFDDNAYYRLLREMEEQVRGHLGPHHPIYQDLRRRNAETIRNDSSKRSREKLKEMYQPIKEKYDEGQYNVDGGFLKFQEDMECFKEEYQKIQGLGPMKITELESFLEDISYSLVEQLDAHATEREDERQEKIREALFKLERLLNEFKDKFKIWWDTRCENIAWLYAKAESIDGSKGKHNKTAIAAAGVSLAAGAASIVIVSLILAPVTFGGSLALGLGVAAGVVGVGAGATAIGNSVVERKVDVNAEEERLKRLDDENAQMKDIIRKAEEIKGFVEGSEVDFEETPVGDDKKESGHSKSEYARHGASFFAKAKFFFRAAFSMVDELADAAKAGAYAAKAAGGVAIVLGVAGMGLDIYTIVKSSKSIKAGNKSEMAAKLREAANQLRAHWEKIDMKMKDMNDKVDDARGELNQLHKRQQTPTTTVSMQ